MSTLRERLTYRPGMTRRRPLLWGSILLAAATVIIFVGYTKTIPFVGKGGTVIRAEFVDATHATKGSDVRVAGVDVGKVEKVQLQPEGGALVEMRIKDGSGITVHRDAKAAILWRTLLGRNMYIDLDPGSADQPKLGNETIAVKRTQVQQELDAAVQPLDGKRRSGLQNTIDELSRAMSNPKAINRVIDASAPFSRALKRGVPAFRGTEPGDLPKLLKEGGGTLKALSRSEEALAGLIDNGRTALGVTAANSVALGATIDQAPQTLAETRETLRRVNVTLDTLDPTADALRPGARDLKAALVDVKPALRKLDVVLDDAEPTVRDLSPAVKRLADAADPARELVDRLNPTVDRLNAQTLPILEKESSSTKLKTYEAIGPFFAALGGSSHTFDRNGNIQNFQSFVDERSFPTFPCVLSLTDPSVPADKKIDCSSTGDVLQNIIGNQLPGALNDYDVGKDADVGDKPQDLLPATVGGGGKKLRSQTSGKAGDR